VDVSDAQAQGIGHLAEELAERLISLR